MSKGSRGGKRPGRAKGSMGMKKHAVCGKSTRNKGVMIDICRQLNRRKKWKNINPMFPSLEAMKKWMKQKNNKLY